METSTLSPRSLKRSHDDVFADLEDLEEPCSVPAEFLASIEGHSQEMEPTVKMVGADTQHGESLPTPSGFAGEMNKRQRSMSGDLTEPASRTPSLRGDSPLATGYGFGGLNGMISRFYLSLLRVTPQDLSLLGEMY